MKNIPDKYLNLISSVPYNISNLYGTPDAVIIEFIKKFRKLMTDEEFTHFLEPIDNQYNRFNRLPEMYLEDKMRLLFFIFGENSFDLILNESQMTRIYKSFNKLSDFTHFINSNLGEVFVGDDVDICRTIKELLECRSYKINSLLNVELCSD